MVSDSPDDDLLTFEDETAQDEAEGHPVWRILIVDDEPSVHEATTLALKGMTLEGRTLEFLHAYSANEARSILAKAPDLAVVLLDVVMESPDAGLQLIRFVREELDNKALRVILRTGQPGYAPEIDTIRAYDINDYKTKSELTRVRLFTSLTVAIRSYRQIHSLETNRRGLELIVAASTELSRPRGLVRFAEGVVTQLCSLLGVAEEGIVCAAGGTASSEPYILAAAGCYSEWIGVRLTGVSDERVRTILEKTLSERRHHFGETTCLYFSVSEGMSMAAFVDVRHALSDLDHNLLKVFCGNIAVAFENTHLLQRISELAYLRCPIATGSSPRSTCVRRPAIVWRSSISMALPISTVCLTRTSATRSSMPSPPGCAKPSPSKCRSRASAATSSACSDHRATSTRSA